jgi:hypothetical protein
MNHIGEVFCIVSICTIGCAEQQAPLQMESRIDLGDVAEGAEVYPTLKLQNRSMTPITCIGAQVACRFGCFEPADELPFTIQPGHTAELALHFHAPQRAALQARGNSDGTFQDTMCLYFDAEGQSCVELMFVGRIVESPSAMSQQLQNGTASGVIGDDH